MKPVLFRAVIIDKKRKENKKTMKFNFNFKNKNMLTKALSIVLVCLTAFGAIMGVSALSNSLSEDTKIINPKFEIGGLDNTTGKYVETEGSIYTKESFECQGLTIKLDFDSQVKYQVFYYDELDEYIGECTAEYDESVELEVPENAKFARIKVTPVWGADVKEKDRVVKWYNVHKYSTQLEISVLKDQEAFVETPEA